MRFLPLAIYLLLAIPSFAQKKQFKEQTVKEILSIIEHPFELLGKTDSEIKSTGRPSAIVGGTEWKVEVFDTPEKNSMDASKSIIIGTGHGAIMLIVSRRTKLVYNLTYLPHARAKIDGNDIIKLLEGKCKFSDGACAFDMAPYEHIGIGALKGSFTLMAFENDERTVKFK